MTRARPALLFPLILLLLPCCAALRRPRTPVPSVEVRKSEHGRCLVVLLPGLYSGPRSFARAGFGEAATRAGIDAEIVAVDAHLGYYRNQTVIERIREDIVLPARAAGREEIWIVGTSLGGLGAILYKKEHPEDLSGIFAIAPFLGDDEVIDEIEAAGGPDGWGAPDKFDDDDVGRKLWIWIKQSGGGGVEVPLQIGWGTDDDFDRSNRMLATLLPPESVYTVNGGHDWQAWTALWEEFLARTRPCGSSGD